MRDVESMFAAVRLRELWESLRSREIGEVGFE